MFPEVKRMATNPKNEKSTRKDATVDKYVIADDLRNEINEGVFSPGEKLPSSRTLAERYGVTQNTATAAVKVLEGEGLVEIKDRSGARVRSKPALLRLGAERYSNRLREETGLSPFRAEVAKQGKSARVDCVSITRATPPSNVAQKLSVDKGSESVVRRENWYFADEEPVQVGITYIPWDIADGSALATSANMGKGSLYGRFEDLGHRITWTREEVLSRMPTREETEGLKVPAAVPVIEVTHTGIDQDDKPFEVTVFTMRADLNGLDYRIRIED